MFKSILVAIIALPLYAFGGINLSDSSQYYFQKGMEEKEKGRKLESVRQFEKSVEFDPVNKAAYMEIATGYMEMNRITFARDAYTKLIELGEETKEVLEPLVLISFQLRKWEDLKNYAAKLKAIDPDAKTNYYLGKI